MITETLTAPDTAVGGATEPPTYRIKQLALTDCYTAVVRGEIRREDFAEWLADAFGAVYGCLRRNGLPPGGPPFARFTFLGDVVAAEAGFPVAREVSGDGRVEPSTLPDGQAAVTTHMGRYEDLDQAYEAIRSWLAANGYEAAGPHWEIYYTDPNVVPDPRRWRTDVVIPYRVLGESEGQ
jgi:effector-binding domain-containing protein